LEGNSLNKAPQSDGRGILHLIDVEQILYRNLTKIKALTSAEISSLDKHTSAASLAQNKKPKPLLLYSRILSDDISKVIERFEIKYFSQSSSGTKETYRYLKTERTIRTKPLQDREECRFLGCSAL
jgi:hypothetical protein